MSVFPTIVTKILWHLEEGREYDKEAEMPAARQKETPHTHTHAQVSTYDIRVCLIAVCCHGAASLARSLLFSSSDRLHIPIEGESVDQPHLHPSPVPSLPSTHASAMHSPLYCTVLYSPIVRFVLLWCAMDPIVIATVRVRLCRGRSLTKPTSNNNNTLNNTQHERIDTFPACSICVVGVVSFSPLFWSVSVVQSFVFCRLPFHSFPSIPPSIHSSSLSSFQREYVFVTHHHPPRSSYVLLMIVLLFPRALW